MGPRQRIEDLMLALNEIPYDDDIAVEQYFSRLKETISSLLGAHNPYVTCLGYLGFRPSGRPLSVEESIRRWAGAKRELRALLSVMLQDPSLEQAHPEMAEEILLEENRISLEEVPQQEDLLPRTIPVQVDITRLSRIRIDLRDLFIMEQGAERFYRQTRLSPQGEKNKVLVLLSGDDILNEKILTFLQGAGVEVIKAGGGIGNPSAQERMKEYPKVSSAVVVMAGDCSIDNKEDGGRMGFLTPAPLNCFEFGLIVGRLGRQRVLAVYQETPVFKRPTGFFDAIYLTIDEQGFWKDEMTARLGVGQGVFETVPGNNVF